MNNDYTEQIIERLKRMGNNSFEIDIDHHIQTMDWGARYIELEIKPLLVGDTDNAERNWANYSRQFFKILGEVSTHLHNMKFEFDMKPLLFQSKFYMRYEEDKEGVILEIIRNCQRK